MKRSTLIFLLGVLLIGGLITLELFSLGILGGADDDGAGRDGVGLLDADGPGKASGATLKGRGDGTVDGVEADEPSTVDPFDSVPAEVRGSTKNGGSIRGRVVRKDGGVPLAGVRVTLGRPDSLLTYLRAKANGRFDELEARTGTDGRFAFLDVTPSKGYVVRARHPDHAICSHDDTIDLTGRDAVDIGDLALGDGGTLSGRVLAADGTPAKGVRVAITWRISNPIGIILADPDTAPEIERDVITDGDGRWTAAKLDPTPKTLIARAASGATEVVRSVSLEDGETKTVDDIRLPGAGTIAGTVLWADGTPIQSARVFAAPRMQAAVRTVETDAKGAFTLRWLPEGEDYVIGTLVEGLPVKLTMGVSLGDEDVRIEFPQAGALRGVVVAAEGGRPVPRFAVQLDDANPPEDWQMRFVMEQVKRGLGPTPFEAEDGTFTFPRLAAGTYNLTVSARGYPDIAKEGITVVAGDTAEIRVEIPRGHVAKGIVRRADGSPLAGARIFVVESLPEGASGPNLDGYTSNREPDAVARGDGGFELPPQSPGTYALIASHPEALSGALRGVDLEAGDVDRLELRMPPCATLRGRLLDEHARPGTKEQVYVVYRNGIARAQWTDEEGRFEFKGLPVGRCVCRWLSLLDARAYRSLLRANDDAARDKAFDDLVAEHGEHDLRDGSVVQVSLRIPRRAEVKGRYTIAGEPPPSRTRRFFVTIEGGGQWIDVELDEQGAFTVRLLPGSYLAYGPGKDGDWVQSAFDVPAGPTHTLDIEIE